MRSSVAITLIVCGTVFALMPSASDYFHGYQVSQFLADRTLLRGITPIHQPFGETFRASAWVLGAAMISLGAVSGGWLGQKSPHRPAIAERPHDMLRENDWRQYERVETINA
jgi:hypothetical protein